MANICHGGERWHDVFVIRISSFGFLSGFGISCFELYSRHPLLQNRDRPFGRIGEAALVGDASSPSHCPRHDLSDF